MLLLKKSEEMAILVSKLLFGVDPFVEFPEGLLHLRIRIGMTILKLLHQHHYQKLDPRLEGTCIGYNFISTF